MISFSEEGLYWHPDHLAVSRLVAAALERVSPAPEWVYGATWPEGHAASSSHSCAPAGSRRICGPRARRLRRAEDSITNSIDVRVFLPAKLAALQAYASQIGPGHLLSALPDDLAEEFLGREYFVRLRPQQSDRNWLAEALVG